MAGSPHSNCTNISKIDWALGDFKIILQTSFSGSHFKIPKPNLQYFFKSQNWLITKLLRGRRSLF